MAKLSLDKLLKVFRTVNTLNATTIVSSELDFDIPRGYVIKLHKVIIEIRNLEEDFETISVDKLARIVGALIRDPDDSTGLSVPVDKVDHDTLLDFAVAFVMAAGTAGDTLAIVMGIQRIEFNFAQEGLDVISARNLRFNVIGQGTDAADLTESQVNCTIHYELVRITDTQTLELLNIL